MIDLSGKSVLVTGAAGFIGAAVVRQMMEGTWEKLTIVGLDSMNDYYDPALKEYRLERIGMTAASETSREKDIDWRFVKGNITDRALLDELFSEYRFDIVVHLAAQTGVRRSIDHPDEYMESNVIGSFCILEACRLSGCVRHLVMASSSSVYGEGNPVPYGTEQKTDTPVSLYAATKKSMELTARVYAKLYRIPVTCLRFFTVYGPGGRPDMAYFKFADILRSGGIIPIYNYGRSRRDFTYINDVVKGVLRVVQKEPEETAGNDAEGAAPNDRESVPFAVYNIGRGCPVNMNGFVRTLTEELIRCGVLPEGFRTEEHMELLPPQPGDVEDTWADCGTFERTFGYLPETDLRDGLRAFAEWYREYH